MAVTKKRVKLKRPVLFAPVKSLVIDVETKKPRKNLVGSGQMVVWVCPYCYAWRSTRRHITDCCAQHHSKLLDAWGSMVEAGVLENPEKKYQGHLPIKTFTFVSTSTNGDNEAHFVGGTDGRYLLELLDGSRYNQAEATLAIDSNHEAAPLLKRALRVWPKGGRGRIE